MSKPNDSIYEETIEKGLVNLADTFLLTYFYQNSAVRVKLITFEADLDLEERVRKAKEYCGKNGWRFVYLEPAIVWL